MGTKRLCLIRGLKSEVDIKKNPSGAVCVPFDDLENIIAQYTGSVCEGRIRLQLLSELYVDAGYAYIIVVTEMAVKTVKHLS